jgi:hypothetical protein
MSSGIVCYFSACSECKTPHTVVQELVVPSAIEIASIMFDDRIVSQIKAIPCSDNTVERRIVEMAADVTDQVVEKNSAAETIRSSVG